MRSIYLKYFLFLYLLAIATFEYFVRVNQQATYVLFPAVTFIFFYTQQKIDFLAVKIIVPFVIVFMLQTLLYGSPFYWSLTLLVRLITFYFTVKIIGKDFLKIFMNSMKVIAVISLFLYMLQSVGGNSLLLTLSHKFIPLGEIRSNDILRPNLMIYTIDTTKNALNFYRNSGPFWEPGLYVIFLNIALFLNLFITKKIFSKLNMLFVVSIITAFSTTGTIGLILVLSIFGLLNKSLGPMYKLLVVIFLIISVPVISTLPFMSDKIDSQINQSNLSYSRFGAAVVHYHIIKDYPFTGMPWSEETYAKYADNISPNGITEIFVRYGIIVGLIYYILLYRTSAIIMQLLGEKNKGYTLFLVFVILIFGETIGNSPIYWALIFAQIPLAEFLEKYKRFKKLQLLQYYSKQLKASLA